MSLFGRLRERAHALKLETLALWLAAHHSRTPWTARLVVAAVMAYVLSPIDLIPDFIPVIGYLDELLIVPLGLALALRLIPADVMAECRLEAKKRQGTPIPRSAAGAVFVVLLWALALGLTIYWLWNSRSQ